MIDPLNGLIVKVYDDAHWYQEIPSYYHIITASGVKDVGCDIRDLSVPKLCKSAVCELELPLRY